MNFFKNLFSTKKHNSNQLTPPAKILSDLRWAFDNKKYQSKDELSKEIKQYQIEIQDKDTWKPDEIVFPSASIEILLEKHWEEPPKDIVKFTFQTEKLVPFTALELMYQLNNFLADHDLGDHHFFEGLTYNAEFTAYKVNLGS